MKSNITLLPKTHQVSWLQEVLTQDLMRETARLSLEWHGAPEISGNGNRKTIDLFPAERIKKPRRDKEVRGKNNFGSRKFYQILRFQKWHFEKDFQASGLYLFEMSMS